MTSTWTGAGFVDPATDSQVLSIIDSKVASGGGGSTDSIARSKGDSAATLANTADSKGASAGLQAATADSKALSVSVLTNTADSKAVSAGAKYDPIVSTSAPFGTPATNTLWIQY